MAGSSTFKNRLGLHYFQNANHANIGDATGLRASTAADSFYIGLFTGARADDSTANECNYTNYARIPVIRSAAGFTVTGANVSNAALVTMVKAGAGTVTQTATHFKIFTALSGGDLLTGGDINPLIINVDVQPEFAIGALVAAAIS